MRVANPIPKDVGLKRGVKWSANEEHVQRVIKQEGLEATNSHSRNERKIGYTSNNQAVGQLFHRNCEPKNTIPTVPLAGSSNKNQHETIVHQPTKDLGG